MSLPTILNAQRAWATQRGLIASRDYTATLEENLFQPLNEKTRLEFQSADGNELGAAGSPGKMNALRSSSALAANFFDHWRDRPLEPLAQALGVPKGLSELRFEQKFPHGVRGKSPNIDVVLFANEGPPLAIESKFAEPYGGRKPYPPLNLKYFPVPRLLWQDAGLPNCQAVADALGHDVLFVKVNAGQLLKHILGLSRAYPNERLRLMYLWYDPRSDEAALHQTEIEQFAALLKSEVEFTALTYQALFERIKPSAEASYVSYLRGRYFAL